MPFLTLSCRPAFVLVAAPEAAPTPLIRFSCKSISARRVPLAICGGFLQLPSVWIPPWRAAINPAISDAPRSGARSFGLLLFVGENASPGYFQILLCSSSEVFCKRWGCLASGVVLNGWKSSLFQLFRLFDHDKAVRRAVYLLHGTRARSSFCCICSGGFPGKCSASISVCKEILLSGQSNK